MSAPLPTPFLSPVFSPFSPDPSQDSADHHESHSEHHDSPHHHHHHSKRERVKSFVKHLASPFASPSPTPEHLPETGTPPNPSIPLEPEPEHSFYVLRKRNSGNSVRSAMKNPPSPRSSPAPSLSSSPFPSPEVSRLSPNPNHSPEVDHHHGSPTRKRERVRSFVGSIRRTSSQLFKKGKKDGEKKSSPTISTLVADSINVSAATTTPSILRRFSHSKHTSVSSITTADSDMSGSYLDGKDGSDHGFSHSKHPSIASITTAASDMSGSHLEPKGGLGKRPGPSPIVEVPTPISPTVMHPVDLSPINPVEKAEGASQGTKPEAVQSDPPLPSDVDTNPPKTKSEPTESAPGKLDPLQFPLPASRPSSPSSEVDPVGPIQIVVNNEEDDDEPVIVEKPVSLEGSTSLDKPAPVDEPAPLNESAPLDKQAPPEEPAPAEEPASSDEPAFEELVLPDEPALEAPASAGKLTPLEEPPSVEERTPLDEPTLEEPASAEEPAPLDKQTRPDEPTLGEQTPLEEPAHHDKGVLHGKNDDHSSDDPKVSTPVVQTQPPPTADPILTIPPSNQDSQSSSTLPSASGSALGPTRDQAMQDLCIPVLIPPMLFWPISNMRLSYIFTPVLTWWLSKGVLNYPSVYS